MSIDVVPERYRKQSLFYGIGAEGQQLLANRKVLLVGCGALGCVLADSLARAGVGFVRIVDRDFVELSNLQRQMLFTEDDVAHHLPKAIAAERRLRSVNSSITVEPIVADVDFTNVTPFAGGMDLILDGTDNFEVRYLLNDVSLELGIPWIFTGCTGSVGQVMPILPNESACLRCLMPSPPPPGTTATCDTAGVLGPAVSVVSAMQSALALKILVGRQQEIARQLWIVDVWNMSFRSMDISNLRETSRCPACHDGERLWLSGQQRSASTILCGRNAVQISPPEKLTTSLPDLAERLQSGGKVLQTPFLLRFSTVVPGRELPVELTIFPDGRTIVKGTEDPAVARSLYSRYVGG